MSSCSVPIGAIACPQSQCPYSNWLGDWSCLPTALANNIDPTAFTSISQHGNVLITAETAGAVPIPISYGDLLTFNMPQGAGFWNSNNSTYIDVGASADLSWKFTLIKANTPEWAASIGTPIMDGDAVFVTIVGKGPPQPCGLIQGLTYNGGGNYFCAWYYLAAKTNRDVELYNGNDVTGVENAENASVWYVRLRDSASTSPSNPTVSGDVTIAYGSEMVLASAATAIGKTNDPVDLYVNYKPGNTDGDLNIGDPSGDDEISSNNAYTIIPLNSNGLIPYWIPPPSTCLQTQTCTALGGNNTCIGSSGQWSCSNGGLADCSEGCECTCDESGTTAKCSQGASVFPIEAGNCISDQCDNKGCLNNNASPKCTSAGLWDCESLTETSTSTWKIVAGIGGIILVAGIIVAAIIFYLRKSK
jgi:hypothetical protein